MDAALELIGTQGWAQTSMRGVCERAQVGPRFLYESFDDLEALAAAVLDEIVGDALARVREAIAAAPQDDISAQVHAGVGTLIAEITDDPRRARLLFAEAHGSPVLDERRVEAVRAIAAGLAEQSDRLLALPAHSAAFVDAAGLLVAGGVAEMVLAWIQGDLDMTREQLIDLTAELVYTIGMNAPAIAARVGRSG